MDRTYYVYDEQESAGNILRIVLLIAVVAIFIFLILKDAVKALRRRAHWRAHWIPGDFLVLSAFIIQLLNLVSAQGNPNSIPKDNRIPNHDTIGLSPEALKALRTLSSDFWMIHTSRIMLCVVVANMMPGMANPGSEGTWGRLMALVLTIFLHISSEVYLVYRNTFFFSSNYFKSSSGVACNLYIPFAILALICFVILILHLGCANIAGRGIAQKIPLILNGQREPAEKIMADSSHHHHHDHSCWWTVEKAARRTIKENADHRQTCCRMVEDVVQREKEKEEVEQFHPRCQQCWRSVEDAVLRAWIVARAYSLEYIIARSALASSAAIIVTSQILITILGGVDQLRLTATILQCIFISIGWLIVIWRWVTSVTPKM